MPANVYRLPGDTEEGAPIERLVLYTRWQGQYLSANRRTALPIVVDIYDFAKAPSVWRERNPDDWGTLYGSQWAMDKQL